MKKKSVSSYVVLKILKNEFPLCFKKGTKKLPLALNIHKKLIQHYKNDLRFDKQTLEEAIRFYTHSIKYLKIVKENTPRISLKGNEESLVTKREAIFAEKLLKKLLPPTPP